MAKDSKKKTKRVFSKAYRVKRLTKGLKVAFFVPGSESILKTLEYKKAGGY